MLNAIKKELNKKVTENGAIVYSRDIIMGDKYLI